MRRRYTRILIAFFWIFGTLLSLFFISLLIWTMTVYQEELMFSHLQKTDQELMLHLKEKLESVVKQKQVESCNEIPAEIEEIMSFYLAAPDAQNGRDIRVIDCDGIIAYSLDKNLIGKRETNETLLRGLKGAAVQVFDRLVQTDYYYSSFPLKQNDKIVGAAMVGSIVTELIGAARALIGSTEKITEISFPHPTVSEVLKEAAEDAFGLSLHNPPR